MNSTSTAVQSGLVQRVQRVRRRTLELIEPLEAEDLVVQTMPDVSPTKWHLAHTTWFFERMVLRTAIASYRPHRAEYDYLFNSYYNGIGRQFPRPQRGLLSRPTTAEVLSYRAAVESALLNWWEGASEEERQRFEPIVELGLNHEEQHQELLLTDIQHVLATNPLHPVYREGQRSPGVETSMEFVAFDGGVVEIGDAGEGFAFDNERSRHRVYLEPFEIATRLITNAEYLAFIEDDGYHKSQLWLSDGWDLIRKERWRAPLYWLPDGADWGHAGLAGRRPFAPHEPVCHLSFYEADAFARWRGCRLPTEFEWEHAAGSVELAGELLDQGPIQPRALRRTPVAGQIAQMIGDVWEWTASPYTPYPNFQPFTGKLGEYNGKFMSNQIVMRGGSCATPPGHIRRTYRNFFYPTARWQFSGLRLARDGNA